jgi:hypothetical protein
MREGLRLNAKNALQGMSLGDPTEKKKVKFKPPTPIAHMVKLIKDP